MATLRKPVYVKLEVVEPERHGYNIFVRVLEKRTVMERKQRDGSTLKLEEVLVGDSSGTMYVTARNEQSEKLKVGETVALRNCRVNMHKGYMRLVIDKWGAIKPSLDPIEENEVKKDVNFSEVEYEKLDVEQ